MLLFNSKLDNSLSATEENIELAIAASSFYSKYKNEISCNNSQAIQAYMDAADTQAISATTINNTVKNWPKKEDGTYKKSTGKSTWCSKRGLLNEKDSTLTELANCINEKKILYQEYCFIFISKIWISDESRPAIFTNALKILSMVDNKEQDFQQSFVSALNNCLNTDYKTSDFHPAELAQFSSLVTSAGFDTKSKEHSPKNVIGKWRCNFDRIKKPHYGTGIFPDFRRLTDIYTYVGNIESGIYEAECKNPSAFNEKYPNIILKKKTDCKMQKIYYGAPGTGKSNEIKKMTAEGGMFTKDCTFRTTFHPDSDYASFVGAYKPYWDNTQSKIVYGFRPQAFLKAYMKAWKNPAQNVALVVEEINRGNCAQIFGDIFQLLDREKSGLSKYPIECDLEMEDFIAKEFANSSDLGNAITEEQYDTDKQNEINTYYSAHYENAFDKIKNGKILALPTNLSILATMNTSDQSLFPMDSAFKRRWEWIYEPIVEGKKEDGESLGWKIEIDDTQYADWWKFLQKINAVINSLTSSEDKQLGYFFCQPDSEDGVTITKNLFVGKVIFYLWNEIFKDYAFEHDVCKKGKEDKSEILYFADFYEGKDVIKQTSLELFFNNLDKSQPKIEGQDVKVLERKDSNKPAVETPTNEVNEGRELPKGDNTPQPEETVNENTEA